LGEIERIEGLPRGRGGPAQRRGVGERNTRQISLYVRGTCLRQGRERERGWRVGHIVAKPWLPLRRKEGG